MAAVETPPPGDIAFVSEQIEQAERQQQRSGRRRVLRPILWRLHFLGGLLAAPILLSLCVTGILFAWNPQIDALRFGDLMNRSAGAAVPLSQQVAAAQAARPDWAVHSVIPGHSLSFAPDITTQVIMDPPGGEVSFGTPTDAVAVFVDETTAQARGEVVVSDLSGNVLRSLHSNWTLGPDVRPLTELAASWFLVSLLTGIYLWWPGLRQRGAAAFAFRRKLRGRRQSKDWHNFIGVALLAPMLFLAITGLTWTGGAGSRYDDAKATLNPPPAGGVETTIAGATPSEGVDLAALDRTSAAAAQVGLVTPVRFVVPTDGGAWKAQSEDRRFPLERDQIAVNGADGRIVDRFDYSDEHWLNKLSTGGIMFHQAELFGIGTQLFMTALAIGIAVMIAFGYRMWWLRRPRGGWGAPPALRDWITAAPLGLLVAVVVLAWALPTLAVALAVWLVLERAWRWWQLDADRRRGRAIKHPLERPGVEAVMAALLGVAGLAMILGPQIGDGDTTLGALGRTVAWAWSVPVGVLFLAAGLIGLKAIFSTTGRPTNRTRQPA